MKNLKARAHRDGQQSAHNDDEEPLFTSKLEDQIETERARLRKAEACLDCLRAAIEYTVENDSDCEISDIGDVADIVRELVHETINRLDSVELDYPPRSPLSR